MSHGNHLSIQGNGLADGCERCIEIAKDPLGQLDQGNLRDLIERTLDDRFGYRGGVTHARSNCEATAMANVMTMLEHSGALMAAAPGAVAEYMNDRWRVVGLPR